jgi:hypothetical protein
MGVVFYGKVPDNETGLSTESSLGHLLQQPHKRDHHEIAERVVDRDRSNNPRYGLGLW